MKTNAELEALYHVGHVDLWTLKLSIEEHVRSSYLVSLKRCVNAGLVIFTDNGRGFPVLTDTGREALREIE